MQKIDIFKTRSLTGGLGLDSCFLVGAGGVLSYLALRSVFPQDSTPPTQAEIDSHYQKGFLAGSRTRSIEDARPSSQSAMGNGLGYFYNVLSIPVKLMYALSYKGTYGSR